jgi:hypothetical protein
MSILASTIQTSNPEIKKLFETYEPEAAKIKEEEKKQLEKAKAESAQQRRPTPAVGATGGMGYGVPGYKPTTPGAYDYYGYPSSGYYGEPSYGYEQPTTTTPTKEPSKPAAPSAPRKEQKELKLPGKDKEKKEEEEKRRKEEEERKKAEEQKAKGKQLNIPGKKGEKKEKPSALCPTNGDSPEGILDLINNNLDFTDILIEESAQSLSDVRKTITSGGKPDNQMTIVTIPRLVKRAQNILDLITKYIDKITGTVKIGAKKTGTDINIKPQLDALYTQIQKHPLFALVLPQLDALIAELNKNDALLMAIQADKRYAYFADQLKPKDASTQLGAPSEQIMKEYNKDTIGSLLDLHKYLDAIRTKLGGSAVPISTQTEPIIPAEMEQVETEETELG